MNRPTNISKLRKYKQNRSHYPATSDSNDVGYKEENELTSSLLSPHESLIFK